MKNISLKFVCISLMVLSSCSSTKLVKQWKHQDYQSFKPKNVLVIGVTPNKQSRKTYEEKLTSELHKREINALQSAIVFESSFKDSKQTEAEIEAQVEKLIVNGYDAILVSLVKGVKERKSLNSNTKADYKLRKFIDFYKASQLTYFDDSNYKEYKVFEIETSIYSINNNKEKALIWVGTYEMIDPENSEKTINKYIKTVLKSLEKEKVLPKKANT